MFVEGLKHNIISGSQMVDNEHKVIFSSKGCKIRKEEYGKLAGKSLGY